MILFNMRYILFVFVIALMHASCTGDEYDRMLEKELSKGKKEDTLFFGIKFGMTNKEFFAHCWEMNKKGIFTDGTNNTAVLYKMKTELKHEASMNFYPDFENGKIVRMKTNFQYDGWAPWNKALFADSLLIDVLDLYRRWYRGNEFIKMTNAEKRTIYVKIDGNRRITIGRFNDFLVKVDYADLLAIKPKNK